MAITSSFTSSPFSVIICFLLLSITLQCATSARFLDEVDPQLPVIIADTPEPIDSTDVPDVAPVVSSSTTLPSNQFPVNAPTDEGIEPLSEIPEVAPVNPPQPLPEIADVAPIAAPVANPEHPILSFFMHDILGGVHPSARVVTGIIADFEVDALPFSKPNSGVFPINGGIPLPNNINGLIHDNNNLAYLAGLNTGSQTTTILQNNGNNNVVANGNNQPFVTAGQLPAGAALQQLMFGSVTVIDDELTQGHELGSSILGKAQGFYLASSLDGTSQTLALTAILHGGDHEEDDTVSFFGVHRTASLESHIAVIGGTGKYENAKGYATIQTLHADDQHSTDGVDTILQINVYLSQ